MDPTNVNHAWHRITARAGLPRIRFNDLRHNAGTLLVECGEDIKLVSAALRHSKIGITADRYAHTTTAMQSETAQAMERIMQHARNLGSDSHGK
jgi:integrase